MVSDSAALQSTLSGRVVEAIRAVCGPGPLALHEPRFAGNEWRYLKECLDSTFVSSVGPFVDRFETMLAEYTGAKHAVAVVNGTAALHIALKLAGVRVGDEVLIPALSFVATANAVAYCGAIPHFADVDERTLGLDPAALARHLRVTTDVGSGHCVNQRTGRVIRAVVPMHTFGHPVAMEELLRLAADFHLAVVEDAAESLGSLIGGRHTGTYGLLGTLSFNGNKTVTTGGGGAILTNDAALAKAAKHLTTTARVPHKWAYTHDEIGYNYRLPNLNAALGCAQLEQLPAFVAAKRQLHRAYRDAFADVPAVHVVTEPDGCRSNYWLQALLLDDTVADQRDRVLEATNSAGILTRPAWTPLHQLAPYRDAPRMHVSVAVSLARRLINVPSSAHLQEAPQA